MLGRCLRHWTNINPALVDCVVFVATESSYRPLGYERVYLPLYKVADTPFHIQGDEL